MKTEVHFSSGKDDWETPPELFAALDREFHFTLDAAATAATAATAKCARFFTPEEDALAQNWRETARVEGRKEGAIWLNPPYSRGLQARFIQKARDEAAKCFGLVVCCLIPARPDTRIWQRLILPQAHIRFLAGRLRFVGAKSSAPFPSAVVIFGLDEPPVNAVAWNWKK